MNIKIKQAKEYNLSKEEECAMLQEIMTEEGCAIEEVEYTFSNFSRKSEVKKLEYVENIIKEADPLGEAAFKWCSYELRYKYLTTSKRVLIGSSSFDLCDKELKTIYIKRILEQGFKLNDKENSFLSALNREIQIENIIK